MSLIATCERRLRTGGKSTEPTFAFCNIDRRSEKDPYGLFIPRKNACR